MLLFAERSSNGRSELRPDHHIIRIADRFSETPFGRYREDGPESGQVFREDILMPALERYGKVKLIFDGLEGLPSSFWEEVMGGLVRQGMPLETLRSSLALETSDPALRTYVRLGWRYAQEEESKRIH